jgi:hypothetical protein
MPLSVREYAERSDISIPAAYKRVHKGNAGALRVGSGWVVPEDAVGKWRPSSRPMSDRNALLFLAFISSGDVEISDPVARSRFNSKWASLKKGDVDSRKLWSWVRSRGPRFGLSASPRDVPDLLADPRFLKSGISDRRAGLSSSSAEAEGYVAPNDVDEFRRDYLLVESDRPNVWVHAAAVSPDASGDIPIGYVVADLLDHGGPREVSRAEEILGGL